MRTIDVGELEANLRDLLRAVRAGESLRVVDDGEVVAEVRPRTEEAAASDLESRLQALAAAGQIRRALIPRGDWQWAPRGLGLDPAIVDELLDDLRSDR